MNWCQVKHDNCRLLLKQEKAENTHYFKIALPDDIFGIVIELVTSRERDKGGKVTREHACSVSWQPGRMEGREEEGIVVGPFTAEQWVPPRDINQARHKRIVFVPGKDPLHGELDSLCLMTGRVFFTQNGIKFVPSVT